MIKKITCFLLIAVLLTGTCSCAPFKKTLDDRNRFSSHLKQTENYIRSEDWKNGMASLEEAKKIWERLRPVLQIYIDHDYINSIEADFIKLSGYMDTQEKSDSLATILLIEETWKNIGKL